MKCVIYFPTPKYYIKKFNSAGLTWFTSCYDLDEAQLFSSKKEAHDTLELKLNGIAEVKDKFIKTHNVQFLTIEEILIKDIIE